ncbi:hypothetical protein D9M72_542640 [compost metagenome]
MEIAATILVNKAIAARLKANPEHVAECMREAEATMNTKALERHRIVNGTPRLHSVQDSAIGKDLVELTFRAPTRAI